MLFVSLGKFQQVTEMSDNFSGWASEADIGLQKCGIQGGLCAIQLSVDTRQVLFCS